MKRKRKLLIASCSGLVGFYCSFYLILLTSLLVGRFIQISLGSSPGLGWFVWMVTAITVSIVGSVLIGYFFILISWGYFHTDKWKINRHVAIASVLIATLGLQVFIRSLPA